MDGSSSTVLLAALGIVSTCVLGLIWVIKYLFQKILPVLEGMGENLDANTRQTATTEAAILKVDTHIAGLNSSHKKMTDRAINSMAKVETSIEAVPDKLQQIADDSSARGLKAIAEIIKESKQ